MQHLSSIFSISKDKRKFVVLGMEDGTQIFGLCLRYPLSTLLHLPFIVFFLLFFIWTRYTINRVQAQPSFSNNNATISLYKWALAVSIALGALTQLPIETSHCSGIKLSRLMQGVAWSLMSFFTYYASIKQESQIFPALLRVWWFLSFLLSILCLTLDIMLLTGYGESTPSIWYDMLAFPMCTFLGFVALYGRTGVSSSSTSGIRQPLIVRDSPNEKLTTKYANANPFSLLTFSWLNPLLNVGSKNPLALDQVPYLTGNDTAQQSVLTFKTNWNVLKAESPPQNPSLAKTIFFSIWKEWSLNALFALAYTISSYAGPPLINLFVEYLGGNRHFHYEGYMLASAFIGIKLIESFARPLWFFGSHRLSLHIRAALTAAIYEKGLRLSNQVRQSHCSGEIINYASIDVHRVGDFAWFWHEIWLLPIQILLAFFILFKSLGLASLAGLAVTVALIFATKPLASLQKTFQGKIMEAKDERMKATSEALRNMRILKLHAWETKYMQKLLDLRTGECGWLWKYLYTKATVNFIFWAAPTFVSAVTFFICVLAGVPLTAGKVLATLATFKILQEPIYLIPQIVSVVVQTKVSLYRIATFLEMEELQFSAVERTESDPSEATIEIEGGEFSWDPCSSTPVLSGINLQVRAGMKVAICGAVGSGKSSLISCILGEMLKISGTVKVRGTRAYVSQSPWIQSRTIQDNIIFGKEMDDIKYNTVLQACALNKDIEMFSYGDQTEIGERGINLSGGQKQRIQLARAIYQDKDIYLLDDPFSAVDAHTGTHLFTECLYGILSSKTILYVTHQVEFLPHADLILVMQGGKITQAGEYSDLLQAGTDFMRLVGSHHHALEIINAVKCSSSVTSMETGPCNGHNINTAYIGTRKTQKQSSTKQIDKGAQVFQKNNGDMASEDPVLRKEQIVKEEEKQKGSVSLQIYWSYLTAVYKGFLIIVILVAQISFQALEISSNYWIASRTPTTVDGKPIVGSLFPIILYIALVLGSSLCLLVRSAFLSKAALQTAQVYFTRMLSCIFHAPIAFFDATPTGRILNRVSTDQTEVDMTLPFNLGNLAFSVIQLLGVITVMSQVAREVFVISIPVLAMIIWYQHYYIATARELARLIGIQKAPIINHFAESISGASTIRAFDQENHFMATNLNLLDDYSRPQFHSSASQEWLGLRLNLLSNFIFAFCIVFLLNFPMDTIDPSIAGLAVTYGLNFTSLQFTLIWNLCCVENKMVSVERILQYCQIPNEGPLVVEETQPDCDWPSNGRVDLCNLQVRYRPHLPFILKGITCTIPGRTKVGVVGRTGSGKSTLVQALFRILEPSEGKIIIDGIDISVIGLHDLRSRLSIIPQDPIMFEGTIRVNLDPLEEHSDAKIWESLHKCQLGVVHEKEDKLNAWVTENGENWSMGQRQLICLGRVLLKKNRILVLDEATASVDTATDSVIQNIIRREFGDCTVITIAHRINTLIDSDLVLVLSDGRIAEYDSPSKLLQCSSSFAKLVGEYSARSSTVSNITTLLQKIG